MDSALLSDVAAFLDLALSAVRDVQQYRRENNARLAHLHARECRALTECALETLEEFIEAFGVD